MVGHQADAIAIEYALGGQLAEHIDGDGNGLDGELGQVVVNGDHLVDGFVDGVDGTGAKRADLVLGALLVR